MSAEFRPKGLETWVYVLDENPIPVLAHTAKQLQQVFSGVEQWALSDVADVICRDPIMTVHLIRETQRVFRNKAVGTLTDVHHCVSLLGEQRVLALARQFKAMKGDQADTNEIAYQTAIVKSFHAAEQIRAWHQVRKQAAMEKNYLAAQLMGVPTWCLWYFANKEMRMIDTLAREERIPNDQAERAVLGCTAQEIVKALAKRWHFPDVILAALDDRFFPAPAVLARIIRDGYHQKEPKIPNKDDQGNIVKTPAFIVALANWLAAEAAIDWYSRQTRRVVAILAAYLEVDFHSARLLAQQAALNVSRKFSFPAIEMPASRLLLPPQPYIRRRISPAKLDKMVDLMAQGKTIDEEFQQRQEPGKLPMQDEETRIQMPGEITKVMRKATDKPSITSKQAQNFAGFVSEEKQRQYRAYMSLLQNNPQSFSSEHEAIRKTLDVLHEVTHIKRFALFAHHPLKKSLKSYYAVGCEQYPELKKAVIKTEPANFFTQLIRKPQGVWVHPERKADIAALVPGVVKQLIQVDEFIAISIFNHRGPIAVLYADYGPDHQGGFSETEFKIVRSVANATSKHLIQRGKRALKS